MKLFNVDGQTERLTNKMKLRLAYHDLAENLKNNLNIEGGIENIPFLLAAVVSGQKTNTNFRWQTHLLCIVISSNSIFMVNIGHSKFHSGILW